MIVTVQPLFEYKYICLKGLNSTINIDGYTVKFNVSDYCVVPYGALGDTSVTYQQTDKYYIKDISFAGTLYNQQYLNVGDPGYDALENYGSYFTAFDYKYSGKTREDGTFPTDELLTLSLDAFGIAMGIVAKVSTTGSVIGMTAKTLGSVLNISSIAKEVIDFGQGVTN